MKVEHFHVAVIDDEYRDRTPAPEGFYKTSSTPKEGDT